MFDESLAGRLASCRSEFSGGRPDFVIASVLAGNTPGELLEVASQGSDRLLLFWDGGNNVLYFAGAPLRLSIPEDLAEAIGAVRERALAAGKSQFKACRVPESETETLPSDFPLPLTSPGATLRYTIERDPGDAASWTNASSYDIVPIDEKLIRLRLEGTERVLAEIRSMWVAEELFFVRGFGFAAVNERAIICACTAEYVSGSMCGIGIETAAAYRNQGIATAVAGAFLSEAERRRIRPYWECGSWNAPSVHLAEKLTLQLKGTEPYWLGAFANGQPN